MNGARLLLVDDEEGIRTVLSLVLADMGHDVRTAANGNEALALLHDRPADVVLTDVRMPGMDGLALLAAVREAWPDTGVIMLTGHGDMELAVKSLRLGATDFLTKPVGDEALAVALDRAFERRRLRMALRAHTEHLEALVEARTRELVEVERLAGMGETAAMLAHAIKNIASSLEGGLFVLGKGIELGRRDYLEDGWGLVREHVARVRDLALHLLDLGKPLTGDAAPVDPDAPVRDVVQLLTARARERGVALSMSYGAGPTPLVLDGEAVRRVLTDLILNAIEAFSLPEGRSGEAAVHVSSFRAEWLDGRAAVRYVVRDNGPGLPMRLRPERREEAVAALLAGCLAGHDDLSPSVVPSQGEDCAPVDAAGTGKGTGTGMGALSAEASTGMHPVADVAMGGGDAALQLSPVSDDGIVLGGGGGASVFPSPGDDPARWSVDAVAGESLGGRLQTTKQGGSGVGLLTVRRIVHELGGEFRLGDAEGGGCEATVSLPVAHPWPVPG